MDFFYMHRTVIFDLVLSLDQDGKFHLITWIYFISNFKLRPHAGRSKLNFDSSSVHI